MSLQFSLGIISLSTSSAVPVTVADGSAVFHYEGRLVAEFDGLKPETVVQWSQVEGIPVTFTSGLTGNEITFTSNDLDKKVFICCTNPGTEVEICARAEFYHFPVSWVDGGVINNVATGTGSNPDYPDSEAFSVVSHYAMLPVDSTLPGYGNAARFVGTLVQMDGLVDEYVETTVSNSATASGLTNIQLQRHVSDDGNTASTVAEFTEYTPVLVGVGSSSLSEWVEFEMYRYGYSYDVIVPHPSTTSPGISEVIGPMEGEGNGGIVGMLSILSTLTNQSFSDQVSDIVTNISGSGIQDMTTIIQTKVTAPIPSDVTDHIVKDVAVSGIQDMTTTLQTAFNVT